MESSTQTIWEIIKYGWSLIIPWNWYLHRRMDKLSEGHVTREEYNETIQSLRRDTKETEESINRQIRECSTQIQNRIDNFFKLLMDNNHHNGR